MLKESIIILFARYLIVIPILLIIMFFLSETNKNRKRIFIYALIAGIISLWIAFICGQIYSNPRPFVVLGVEPLIPHSPVNGFPSNHVLLSATISAVLFLFSKKLSLVSWIVTILVGLGRVLALVHHSLDVVASVVISIFSVWITTKIVKYSLEKYT